MPKNLKGGNKAKGMKNGNTPTKKREIPVPEKEDDSHIVLLTKCLGDSRYTCQITDMQGTHKEEFIVHMSSGVKNKYAKGIIISAGNTYALVSFRSFQQNKGDILFLYRDSEIPFLIERNLMTLKKGTSGGGGDGDADEEDIVFIDGINIDAI